MIPFHNIDIKDGKLDARQLHATLRVGAQFANWMKRRIKKCGLEAGVDYWAYSKHNGAGRPSDEYDITVLTGIILASVESDAEMRKWLTGRL